MLKFAKDRRRWLQWLFEAKKSLEYGVFYSEIQQHEKLQPLVGEISWTKNILIVTKCKDPLEREFYMLHVSKFGWTKAVRKGVKSLIESAD